MSAYATSDEFRASAWQASETEVLDAKVDVLLTRASRIFDRLVGVADDWFAAHVLGAPDNPTAQTFYPDGTGYLKLPPYVAGSLTTVTMPTGYTVPSYVQRDGYLLIKDLTTGVLDPWGYWPVGVPVTVTAKWGYASVPVEITQVVINIAIMLWRAPDPAFAKTADLEGISLELSALDKSVVDQYQTKRAVAFV